MSVADDAVEALRRAAADLAKAISEWQSADDESTRAERRHNDALKRYEDAKRELLSLAGRPPSALDTPPPTTP